MAAATRLLSSPPPPGGISKVKTARCKIHPRPFPPTLRHHRHHHRPTTLRRATQNPRGSHALHRDYPRPRRDTASKQAGGRERAVEIIVSVLPTTNFFPPNFYRQFSPGKEFEALRSRSSREKDYAANGREAKGREGRKQGISANSREIADPLERRSHSTRSDSLLRVVSLCVMGFAAPRLIRALSRTNSDTSQEGICQLRIRGVKQEDPRSSSRLYKLRIEPLVPQLAEFTRDQTSQRAPLISS